MHKIELLWSFSGTPKDTKVYIVTVTCMSCKAVKNCMFECFLKKNFFDYLRQIDTIDYLILLCHMCTEGARKPVIQLWPCTISLVRRHHHMANIAAQTWDCKHKGCVTLGWIHPSRYVLSCHVATWIVWHTIYAFDTVFYATLTRCDTFCHAFFITYCDMLHVATWVYDITNHHALNTLWQKS